ncbi:MAG: putative ral secretion pathway protein component of type secretion system [Pseudomonadota bacterium]|jgi:general secretion pathway protein L
MSSLFIHLPPGPVTAASEFAYVLSVDGRSPGRTSSAPATLLPATHGAGSETVAVVPAGALSWHRLEWPRGLQPASARLRAALEGLLEDHLLDEPEALHFAVEPQAHAGEPAWVAVCDRAWLRACLQALDAAGHGVTRIVPEVAPEAPAALYVLGEPDHALVVARSPRGVVTLPLAAASLPLLPALPDGALCFAEPAIAEHAEALLQRPLVLQPAAERWLQAAQSDWNLAQFDLARTGRGRAVRRLATWGAEWLRAPQWRPARWGLALLLAANLVGLNAWAWKERAALDSRREAVRAVLVRAFAQAWPGADPLAQMEREVAALRQATATPASGDLETLLGALATLTPARAATGLDYARSTLRVRGLGWTATDLRAAGPRLQAQGLSATLQGDELVLRAQEHP